MVRLLNKHLKLKLSLPILHGPIEYPVTLWANQVTGRQHCAATLALLFKISTSCRALGVGWSIAILASEVKDNRRGAYYVGTELLDGYAGMDDCRAAGTDGGTAPSCEEFSAVKADPANRQTGGESRCGLCRRKLVLCTVPEYVHHIRLIFVTCRLFL